MSCKENGSSHQRRFIFMGTQWTFFTARRNEIKCDRVRAKIQRE